MTGKPRPTPEVEVRISNADLKSLYCSENYGQNLQNTSVLV